jgi:catechol 2,3-dioxygenase-like lactoylglutathione lyase family enzyme
MSDDLRVENRASDGFGDNIVGKMARICFTCIPVTDVRKSAEWYSKLLGFKPDFVFETHAIVQPDLQLIRTDGPVVHNQADGMPLPRAAFFCEQLLEFHRYLAGQGVRTEEIVDEGECGRRFDLYDPDGNRITVWQAG